MIYFGANLSFHLKCEYLYAHLPPPYFFNPLKTTFAPQKLVVFRTRESNKVVCIQRIARESFLG